MYQNIAFLPHFFDKSINWEESVSDLFFFVVLKAELMMADGLWIHNIQIRGRNDGYDVVFLQFFNIICEMIATQPYLAQGSFFLDDFLALIEVGWHFL